MMNAYLKPSRYIDCNHPLIVSKARQLSQGLNSGENSDEKIAKVCYEFVRDEIKHSLDFKLNPVTCKASDVLKHGTGYCYAKSHLLAALLRANSIPAGLCYQRLTIENDMAPFCLHGLNAVFLESHGWYRMDARGNKKGVDAQFDPPVERLAFEIIIPGEADLLEIWPEPAPIVIEVLTTYTGYADVALNLPDIQMVNKKS